MADTVRAEEVGSATAAEATAVTVMAVATATPAAEATEGMVGAVDMGMALAPAVEVTVVTVMAVDIDRASTRAEEATATAMAVDTGVDTAGGDTTAVVTTDMITATGAVAATTAAHTGAVRYSALGSAMFHRDRFVTTPTAIRYRVTCRHTAPTRIEIAGPGGPARTRASAPPMTRASALLIPQGVDWIDASGAASGEPDCE
jgi:hypothetical protein